MLATLAGQNRNDMQYETAHYLVEVERLYAELQKIERQLLALLKARRVEARQGFDALITREEAAKLIDISTRQLDRLREKGGLRSCQTVYGVRYRMGDIIAYAQMRCEVKNIPLPRPYRKKGYMSDLDKMLGELMEYDLSLTPTHIRK